VGGDDLDVFHGAIVVNAVLSGIGIIALTAPIYGALKYKSSSLVGFGVAWLVAVFFVTIIVDIVYVQKVNDEQTDINMRVPVFGWFINGVITALIVYPHVGLMMEIKKGIMSKETYPREAFSCCCTYREYN
jgi:heme/copper-type cytochrome/quinol oxidase subunit 2